MTVMAQVLPAWIMHLIAGNSMFSPVAILVFFMLIFIETAGVIVLVIPADTILVTVGSLSGLHHNIWQYLIMALLLGMASLAGDAVNYYFGSFLLHQMSRIKWVNKHVNGPTMRRLQSSFHHKRWLLFVVLGRFLPFIRSAVPLLAHEMGLAFVDYIRFAAFASFLWSFSVIGMGYFFGQLELPGGVSLWLLLIAVIVIVLTLRSRRFREWIIRFFLKENEN